MPELPEVIVRQGLTMICESFDIPLAQSKKLRGNDRIQDLYRRVRVSDWHDDMELERLGQALGETLERKINEDEFSQIETVEQLLLQLNHHRRIIEQGEGGNSE